MGYSKQLTSVLTGATPSQLEKWRQSGLVVPEVRNDRPPLWSFRDLMLLRSIVFLRAHHSSQKIHQGFANIRTLRNVIAVGPDQAKAVFEHASGFVFGTDGRTIYLGTPEGEFYDLLQKVKPEGAQPVVFSAELMLKSFENFKGAPVVALREPSRYLQLDPARMGGVPTITGTRVPFDVIARLVDYETVFPCDVPRFYSGVSSAAAEDACEFSDRVASVG